jgi:hypothetical protein
MLLDRDIITVHASAGITNYLRLILSTDAATVTEFRIDPSAPGIEWNSSTGANEGPQTLLSDLLQCKRAHFNADYQGGFDAVGDADKITEAKIAMDRATTAFTPHANDTGSPSKSYALSSLIQTIGRTAHLGFEPTEGPTIYLNPAAVPIVIDDVQYTCMIDLVWYFMSRSKIKMTPYMTGTTLTKLVLETDD